jgi:putative membrane protein
MARPATGAGYQEGRGIMSAAFARAFGAAPGVWAGHGAFGWPWWPGLIWLVIPLLLWGGLMAMLVWAVRAADGPRRGPDTAMRVLRRRLASGEITEEEYERIRGMLRSDDAQEGRD